jgi:hypothetical protein
MKIFDVLTCLILTHDIFTHYVVNSSKGLVVVNKLSLAQYILCFHDRDITYCR